MVSMIVALDLYNGIGKDNKLPWTIEEDLAYFKEKTYGKVVVMGRKTYESIGRPLPGRTNVVISRNTNLQIPGVIILNSLDEMFAKYESEDVFIIGGSQIYRDALERTNKLYITLISGGHDCDTFFPEFMYRFSLTEAGEHRKSKTGIGYRFTIWDNIKKEV